MAYMGMVTVDTWDTKIKEEDWTANLFREYPNGNLSGGGAIPLTGLSALAGGAEQTSSPTFHWFQKTLAAQSTTTIAAYSNAAMTITYATTYATNNAPAGANIYLKVPEAFSLECYPGCVLTLHDASENRARITALVMAVDPNGANSRLTVRLLEADTATVSYGIATVDEVQITGSSFSEGSNNPEAIHYDPTEYENYCGIHKTTVEQSGTALASKDLRTEAGYTEDVREQGELHEIGKEWLLHFSVKSKFTNPYTKKDQRTSMGVLEFLGTYAPANIVDFRRDTDAAGKTWAEYGHEWINKFLVDFSVWGPSECAVLCGNYVLKAVADAAFALGWPKLETRQLEFGISVHTWVTPYGELNFKVHPLYSRQEALKRMALIFYPPNIKRVYMEGRDGMFMKDVDFENDQNVYRPDAKREGWLSEVGYKFKFARQFALMDGFGCDNS